MNEIKLQYPTGIFSHSELADFNKMDKLKILPAYKEAIAKGEIVSMGSRKSASGRGRPTFLWKVNDGTIVPTPVIEDIVAELPSAIPAIAPVVAPIVVVDTVSTHTVEDVVAVVKDTVEIIRIGPENEPVIDLPHVTNIVSEIVTLNQVCPMCKTPLSAMADSTGVMVYCHVLNYDICHTHENPAGHSNRNKDVHDAKTVQEAYETLCQKFSHVRA